MTRITARRDMRPLQLTSAANVKTDYSFREKNLSATLIWIAKTQLSAAMPTT